jgi:putative transposase
MILIRKIKIKLKKEDKAKLGNASNLCRILYNTALEQRIIVYKQRKKCLSVYDQKKELVQLKEEIPEFKEVYNKYLSNALFRLDRAFKSFLKRGYGLPRYRGKHYFFTLECPAMYVERIDDFTIKLPQGIIVRTTERIPDKFKDIQITKKGDDWFIVFPYEVKEKQPSQNKNIIACDLGLRKLVTGVSTTGDIIEIKHRKPSMKELKRLDNLRSKRDRCKRYSRRWLWYTKRLHDELEEWRNRVKDWLHKVSSYLVGRTEGTLVIGNLKPSMMNAGFKFLNRYVKGEWRIGEFIRMLKYKCLKEGKMLILQDETYTSQDCCQCGYRQKLELSDRIYICPECGLKIDRDLNSAFNMLKRLVPGRGHTWLQEPCGVLATARNLVVDTFVYN